MAVLTVTVYSTSLANDKVSTDFKTSAIPVEEKVGEAIDVDQPNNIKVIKIYNLNDGLVAEKKMVAGKPLKDDNFVKLMNRSDLMFTDHNTTYYLIQTGNNQ
ncbi:hypothetical protein QQ008_01980 [Fulvivirgaceae bacterium BMA10]|uniref:Uncharacterized protein n=1 Tax=Splendidivirga corallicola TaxID=3051826 RepID=A0ABT8KHB0_9BACT|nr:hypothetical protein [Fulvivirgaceae bacterium BMA10]